MRFAIPECLLQHGLWAEYRKKSEFVPYGYGGLGGWKECGERLEANWLALMEVLLSPGAWGALRLSLKTYGYLRKAWQRPGWFLLTKKKKLRYHWRWSKRQRVYWIKKKKLKKPNTKGLNEEVAKNRTKYLNALGTTELNVTQVGSGIGDSDIEKAAEMFEGVLTVALAVLSGGIYSPQALSWFSSPDRKAARQRNMIGESRFKFRPARLRALKQFANTMN